jgi:hypothetical protein
VRIPKATDADIERIVTFRRNGKVATITEISNSLGIAEVVVAQALYPLLQNNVVDRIGGRVTRYFIKI